MALDTHVKIEEMIANLEPVPADGAMALTRQRPPPPHHSRTGNHQQQRPFSSAPSGAGGTGPVSGLLRPASSSDANANGAPATGATVNEECFSEEAPPPLAPPRHSSLGFDGRQAVFDENSPMARDPTGGRSGQNATVSAYAPLPQALGMYARGTPPPVAPRPSLKSTKVVML